MKSAELRQKFLAFFEKNGHKVVPSASLIPNKTDGTALFITAGMQPLVPYLLGEKHPEGKRIVDIQKCFRTVDIDEVGDDTHNTFFEMLGNWSLGDYWKKESISWSFEFLTKELNIPLERLAVSCFAGDKNAPKDEESAKIWEELGVNAKKITFLPKEDNWWGPVGETGPCGPDTEIFYWKANNTPVPKEFDPKNKNWVEIWNNVFMEYVKTQDGKYMVAEQKNVDTGMGFERTLAILNGFENIYQTDLFAEVNKLIPGELHERERRIILDHVRAILFMICDHVIPENKGRGYVLRRLIRRVITITYLNREKNPIDIIKLFEKFVGQYQGVYKNLDLSVVRTVYALESEQFRKVIEEGVKLFEKAEWMGVPDGVMPKNNESTRPIDSHVAKVLPAEFVFDLYQTYGLQLELILELAKQKDVTINVEEFNRKVKEHQEKSRTASAGMFKGGLADHEPATVKLHTAHHLLLAALQELFGKEVKQRGSNINQERLRLDFSFGRKITDEEKQQLQDWVNDKISQGLDVVKKEMPLDEAKEIGAEMEFGVKYGNTVNVYFIEDKNGNAVSKEFCGGPHVANTKELGKFKIIKEEASSQGVRRIKAVVE